jgi:hypothetical protein
MDWMARLWLLIVLAVVLVVVGASLWGMYDNDPTNQNLVTLGQVLTYIGVDIIISMYVFWMLA